MSFDKTELLQRWAALSARERLLSVIGSVAFIIGILYALVYLPFQADNTRLQQQIHAQQDLHIHLQAVAQRVAALRAQGNVQSEVTIEPARAVADSSQQMALNTFLQIQPESAEGIAVTVSQIAFDKLVYWLALLRQQHGLHVATLNLRRSQENAANVDGELLIQTHH